MSRWSEGAKATLAGRVARIRFESDDGDYQVLLVEERPGRMKPAVVRGAGLMREEQVTLRGTIGRHRGELQLQAEHVERTLPRTAAGVEAYLASSAIKGVGATLARDIVATFGDKTLEVLDQEPGRLREVPGVGAKRAEAIAESWAQAAGVRQLMIYLQSRGVSPAYAVRIRRAYGGKAVRVLEQDPYRLAADIRGIGFRLADRIARTGGIGPDDPRRLRAGIVYALEVARGSGHVYLPQAELLQAAADLLEVTTDGLDGAVDALVGASRLVVDGDGSSARCYLADALADESELAALLAALGCAPPALAPPTDGEMAQVGASLGFELDAGQRDALARLLGKGVSVLTGGPGTGKTTIVRAAVSFVALRRGTVALAAPTGRAAKRLSESTGEDARTLHRLLGYDPRVGDFTKGPDDPIEADLVVVDEASMLDQSLALALARALQPTTALLLVGDVEQLPSVGAGDVLADVIASGAFEVARLERVFRQAGDSAIIDCAHAVRSGQLPTPSRDPSGEFFFIESPDPERIVDTVRRVVTERLPAAFGLSPLDDVQCLVPMNGGPVGTRAFNSALQERLAQPGPALKSGEQMLRLGDKVMQVRNNYDLDVFNGDIGVVVAVDPRAVTAVVSYESRHVTYKGDQLDQLQLAYAVTVHKSQGSEFRAVVLVLTTHHFKLLQRNLVYTAITRARERLVIVGTRRALQLALSEISIERRYTHLAPRIAAAV